MVSDGPSLIESCDFCVFMKISSTLIIGLVLHDRIPRFIIKEERGGGAIWFHM